MSVFNSSSLSLNSSYFSFSPMVFPYAKTSSTFLVSSNSFKYLETVSSSLLLYTIAIWLFSVKTSAILSSSEGVYKIFKLPFNI